MSGLQAGRDQPPPPDERLKIMQTTFVAATSPRPLARLYAALERSLDALQPFATLAIRLYVAKVFALSGWLKISRWDSTLALFENEYHVPLLAPHAAAVLGTAAELMLPLLFVLGIRTRAVAIAFFVFNIVAVISYPDLGEVGLRDHQTWGLLLLVTLLHGPGALSLDHLIGRRYANARH